MHRINKTILLFLLFALPVSLSIASTAEVTDDLTGEHLEPLIEEEIGTFTLSQARAMNDASVQFVYETEDGVEIQMRMGYGADAADAYRELRGQLGMANPESHEIQVQGKDVTLLSVEGNLMASTFFDQWLIAGAFEGVDAEAGLEAFAETASAFFEAFDLERLAEWSPPEGVNVNLADVQTGVTDCYNMDCFGEAVAACEPAQLYGMLGRNVTARYLVEEPVGADQCQVSFVFKDNPNDEWENQPMYFTLDRDGEFSQDLLMSIMDECTEGDREAYNCDGPLLDLIGQ